MVADPVGVDIQRVSSERVPERMFIPGADREPGRTAKWCFLVDSFPLRCASSAAHGAATRGGSCSVNARDEHVGS